MLTKEALIKSAAVLTQSVYIPVFFNTLKSLGVNPSSVQEQQQLLEAATQVKIAAMETLGFTPTNSPSKTELEAADQFLRENKVASEAAENLAIEAWCR